VSKGIIAELTVTWSPMGTTVKGKASSRLAAVEKSGLNATDYFPVATLLEVAEKGGLHTRPGKSGKKGTKVEEAKPSKSLVPADFELSVAALQQRCNEIAKACGGGPLVGRVRAEGRFKGAVTTSYRDWWDGAHAADRLLSLTEGKRRSTFDDPQSIEEKMSNIQCPFRGTLEFEVATKDEEPVKAGPSSSATGKGKQPA